MSRFAPLALRTVLAIAAALVLTRPVCAQHGASRYEAVVEIARRELSDTRTPGAAIALVEGDRVVFVTGVGVADVESGSPIRPEMLFRLGSTTKMFTATALVTLAEEGRLSLGAPIGSKVPGLQPALARLTAHQLLSHTAGLHDEAPMFGRHDDAALGDGIRAMTADVLFTEPASIYSYSNPGYWISGFLVETLAGKPYADAMQERVFTPLGMARSTFRPMMAITYPIAQGHEAAGSQATVIRPAANNVATWPAGSMFSNVHDLSRFVIAFMNQGRIDGRQVLPPSVIARLTTAHAAIPGGVASYGYGLQLSERKGVRLVSHGGSRAGYGSTIMMVPSRRAAAIVLGNRSGSGLPRTARRALEMLLQVPEDTLDTESDTANAAMAHSDVLKAWVGRYSQGSRNVIELLLKDDALVVREGSREQPATLKNGLRLVIGNGGAAPQATWILVPDRDGTPAYLFRGGRAFRRIP